MSSIVSARTNVPQAFVSSYAPRLRLYANSLLTPVQAANPAQPSRSTKRGNTAVNYSEDHFDFESLDSDAPRRATGLRSRRQEEQKDDKAAGNQQGEELYEPVDVQTIWREWMGKPRRHTTEKQAQTQAQLPLNLVPIRIDLKVDPYIPDPALPKPYNARELGLDENAPAYRQPELTPEFRLTDYFLWNLYEQLITPDQFAKVFVDEMDFPKDKQAALIMSISQQIRQQLEDHAGVELHPYFNKDKPAPAAETRNPSGRPSMTRDNSGTPLRIGTPNNFQTNGFSTPTAPTPLPNGASITATAETLPKQSVHNPDDMYRCVVSLSLNLQNRLLTDKFEWSLLHPPGFPEVFAKQTCADLGLSGEWVPALAHSIYEAVLKLKKEVCENGGSLLGIVGSGVNAYGEIDNEAAEVHGDGSLAVGEGAGWRYDQEHLGDEWEPRLEILSKEEIEKREYDRERQLRRMRRETAARGQLAPQSSFYGNSFNSGADAEEERMGRGERSKKKKRFRSLSPSGRDSPDLSAAFGGESGKLSEGERQYWHCSHCRIWGGAVWSIRDGPNGSRTLCNNCGLLYERDKQLPPWSKDLYAFERPAGTERPAPQPQSQSQPQTQYTSQQYVQPRQQSFTPAPAHMQQYTPERTTPTSAALAATRANQFIPDPRRAHTQTFYRHSEQFQGARTPLNLPEQYAATVRGGGPSMFEDYAIEGEDLDWTKITDPRERKRLQNIINGRKYRERRLAQEAAGLGGGSLTPGREGSAGAMMQSPAVQSGGQGGFGGVQMGTGMSGGY